MRAAAAGEMVVAVLAVTSGSGWAAAGRGSSVGCGRPCDHAGQYPAVLRVLRAPDSVHRQWLDLLVMRAETRTHSANCAHDSRDYSGAVLGPG